MDGDLKLEVEGRSLKSSAYDLIKRSSQSVDDELVLFMQRAKRNGLTDKQTTKGLNEIIDRRMDESEESIVLAVAKDVLNNIKLAFKRIG